MRFFALILHGRNNRGCSIYDKLKRREWAALRANTPLVLSETDLNELRGLNNPISLTEASEIYLPLSRLLNLHFKTAKTLSRVVESSFLGRPNTKSPYVIGIAGSVAVGKSTFARLLKTLLSRWPERPTVDLVTTDGFLYPRKLLEERNLMQRKGFPESYDLRRMLAFLSSVKADEPNIQVPFYSHEAYDIVPDRFQEVDRPDILIFEGLNVLQTASHATVVASDFFDFSIYLNADSSTIQEWYVERFLLLQKTSFQKSSSYFHHYHGLTRAQAEKAAREIWNQTNLPNLEENILPTRERAKLVIRKSVNHTAEELWLRQL